MAGGSGQETEAGDGSGGGMAPNYHVSLNDAEANAGREYPSNFIRTALYTIITFLPLNLFTQFQRFSNIYFLLTAIVSLTPVSPLSPVTTISPLVFVLTTTAIKDAYEDYQRHKADRAANAAEYEVYRNGHEACGSAATPRLTTLQSADLVVGDVLKIHKGQLFPADLVALASSEDHGLAYVETANLDGETNLKRRFTPPACAELRTLEHVAAVAGEIVCEPPTVKLYKFEGTAAYADGLREPLTHANLLLRGSKLRNTEYVFGVVVYAGVDTKLFKNLKMVPAKVSRVQHRLNKVVLGIFLLNVVMLLSAGLMSGIMQSEHTATADYFGSIAHESAAEVGALHCISYFVLFTYLIPISLFVSVEIVRVGQQLFMNWDADMAADPDNVAETGMLCRNSNMNEELGEIDHIFADKTGTLTCNVMELAQWSVAGTLYDQRDDPACLAGAMIGAAPPGYAAASAARKNGSGKAEHGKVAKVPQAAASQHKAAGPPSADISLSRFEAPSSSSSETTSSSGETVESEQQSEVGESPHPRDVVQYLRAIALCHTVVPELLDDGTRNYEAESPDEAALVDAAAANGVVLLSTAGNGITISVCGVEENYQVAAVLEFTSDRKRMSVIVQDAAGEYMLYIKGADNLIMDRLRPDEPLLAPTQSHLEAAAREGLRTLLVAQRTLDRAETEAWLAAYREAQTLAVGRAEAVAAACEAIEVELELLGATAVEDKLQVAVPETLEFLLRAGVYVWVLTGDKRETAENIGYSSRLLAPEVDLIRLLADTPAELEELIAFHEARIGDDAAASDHALITDGHTLALVLESAGPRFLDLAQRCGAVICCRVTPLQKAQVVALVKDNLGRNTLAIGDGANDVSMIQTAHVGVGVVGKEGNQAVRASDFAIHQFRFLAPLLVVHGKRSLIRLALLIQYSFYKNVAFIFPQWLFGFYSLWSAQIVYDEIILTFFNMAFAALPPLYFGLWERRVPKTLLLAHPQLYKAQRDLFNLRSVFTWLGAGLYHGIVAYFTVFHATVGDGAVYANGQVGGIWVQGYFLSTILIVVVLLKAALHTSHWTSLPFYLVISALYLEISYGTFNESVLGTMSATLASPSFWWALPIVTTLCLLPDFLVRYAAHTFAPEPWVIVREQARLAGISEKTTTGRRLEPHSRHT
ncbi:uncharacterized protein AMSG_04177 [Thecamonas trahens ATCC 50062]|uniref:Phospholipid-transporting ATPase n=1 Tax=Thecamonas trahens ATCC 50062 TaxID=461836 RepID=A0A0L0D6D0_THETB|nr:transmembrane protein [Thecamonas trahens ATCC 50062]KNC47942.1 transmembrane protein [Thecamonas trahens ATCC 50062]|eukprot:XP_013758961.1 transmembrane protein [Thecamonas trahens ATCC 50062]